MGNKGAGKGGDSTIVLSRGREKSEGEGLEKATIFKGFEQRRGDHFLVADVSLSGEPIYPHPAPKMDQPLYKGQDCSGACCDSRFKRQ